MGASTPHRRGSCVPRTSRWRARRPWSAATAIWGRAAPRPRAPTVAWSTSPRLIPSARCRPACEEQRHPHGRHRGEDEEQRHRGPAAPPSSLVMSCSFAHQAPAQIKLWTEKDLAKYVSKKVYCRSRSWTRRWRGPPQEPWGPAAHADAGAVQVHGHPHRGPAQA